MLKAVIFDMDGVLVDSEPLHMDVNLVIHKELGIEIPPEEYKKFIGVSNLYKWTTIKEKYHLDLSIEEIVKEERKRVVEYIGKNLKESIPGVKELIYGLKSKGVKLAVASSSSRSLINTILKNTGLTDVFSYIISGEEVQRSKPSPDIFLKAAEGLSADPGECAVFEDSKNGTIAAKAAGMYCIGYLNPTSGNQDISISDRVISAYSEITFEDIEKAMK